MVIGIECEFKTNSSNFYQFFNGIDMGAFSLVLVEEDFYEGNNDTVWPEKINGEEFINRLKREHPVVIFLNCQAFFNDFKCEIAVDDYKTFVKSECEFVLFVIDCNYIEIYAKNDELLKQFIKNAEHLGCEEIIYKTEENDSRTVFRVF